MAGKTAARREELRSALLDAAERMIVARGLPALKARTLAEAVGCAVGAIYTVFPNLDALVFAVNGRTLDLFEAFLGREAGGRRQGAEELVRLAILYTDFAIAHGPRWRALFDHRAADSGEPIPAWYAAAQAGLFLLVEGPIRALRPRMAEQEAAMLARTLFSAVHGIVSLGLDAKLGELSEAVLKGEVRRFVGLVGEGLSAK